MIIPSSAQRLSHSTSQQYKAVCVSVTIRQLDVARLQSSQWWKTTLQGPKALEDID